MNRRFKYVAISDCHFCVVEKGDFLAIQQSIRGRLFEKDVDFFLGLPQFSQWTRTAIRKLVRSTKAISHRKGDYVLLANSRPENVFVVKAGEYAVLANIEHKVPKERKPITLIGPQRERAKSKAAYDKLKRLRKGADLDYTVESEKLTVDA